MTTAVPTSAPTSATRPIDPARAVAKIGPGHDVGEVFAAGSTARRRLVWAGVGVALLVFAGLDLAGGLAIPTVEPFTTPAAGVLAILGVLALLLGLLRRTRGYEITRQGVVTLSGGRIFGDRHLFPWSSLQRLGGRRVGKDRVRLFYVQQHVARKCLLKGPTMTVGAYDHLIDRLRVVVGEGYKNLKLGGLEG